MQVQVPVRLGNRSRYLRRRRLRPKRNTFPRAILQYPANMMLSQEQASGIKKAWQAACRTRLMDDGYAADVIRAAVAEEIAQAIWRTTIPAFEHMGPMGAADWMRSEAANTALRMGGTP